MAAYRVTTPLTSFILYFFPSPHKYTPTDFHYNYHINI